MSSNKTPVVTINFSGLLLTAFIVMKLCGVINWSWWWVLAPLWGLPAIILVILGVMAIGYIINESTKVSSFSRKQDRAMRKLRKKMRKGELNTSKFIKMADTILENHKNSAAQVDRFSLMDFEATVSDSVSKSIRRHKEKKSTKKRFSLKRWWKEGCVGLTFPQKIKIWWKSGNKKAVEKKAEKKKKVLDIKK